MNSYDLISECENRGLMSKEAADEVRAIRSRMIKEAISKEANSFFSRLGKAVSSSAKDESVMGGIMRGFKGEKTLATDGGKRWSEVVGSLGRLATAAGLATGTIAGGAALLRRGDEKNLRGEIESSYKEMFEEDPRLNNIDRHKVQRHFGVLARYAPSLAANPTVAASWVRGAAELNHVDPKAIGMLAQTQAEIDRSADRNSLFPSGHFQSVGIPIAKSIIGS